MRIKRYATLALVAVLSACDQAGVDAPAAVDEAAAAAPLSSANGSPPGQFIVVDASGGEGTTTMNADGTFSNTGSDGKVSTGTWAVTDGKTCFTPSGNEPTCWSESTPDEDGAFTATSDSGEKVTVKPILAPTG